MFPIHKGAGELFPHLKPLQTQKKAGERPLPNSIFSRIPLLTVNYAALSPLSLTVFCCINSVRASRLYRTQPAILTTGSSPLLVRLVTVRAHTPNKSAASLVETVNEFSGDTLFWIMDTLFFMFKKLSLVKLPTPSNTTFEKQAAASLYENFPHAPLRYSKNG